MMEKSKMNNNMASYCIGFVASMIFTLVCEQLGPLFHYSFFGFIIASLLGWSSFIGGGLLCRKLNLENVFKAKYGRKENHQG